MKRFISLIIVFALLLSVSTTAFATDKGFQQNDSSFSFYSVNGDHIYVTTSVIYSSATSEVYVNGVLSQRSVANGDIKAIDTEIYGSNKTSVTRSVLENGFSSTIIYSPASTKKVPTNSTTVQSRSVLDEPVDNAGLSASGYFDGYYYLGSYGGFWYAPDVYGYLYRSYSRESEGVTKYWKWGAGETLSAISAYISLYGGPVSKIVGLLIFTGDMVLSYTQAVELDTYTFDYHYKVRVNGTVYYTAERNITYWHIKNETTNNSTWAEKSFNYGFTMANTEMVKFGVDNYVASTQ